MSDQTPASFNSARKENPKKTGAIPKKKTPLLPENDATATSNSALEADHDRDCSNSKPELKTDRIVNYLLKSISEKEAELECPVALSTLSDCKSLCSKLQVFSNAVYANRDCGALFHIYVNFNCLSGMIIDKRGR